MTGSSNPDVEDNRKPDSVIRSTSCGNVAKDLKESITPEKIDKGLRNVCSSVIAFIPFSNFHCKFTLH